MRPFSEEICSSFRAQGYWGDRTLYQLFETTARRAPEREGLVDPPNREELVGGAQLRLTYREMSDKVDQLAEALRDQGLGPGDIVATQLPNIAELVLLYLAIAKIGAILSPFPLSYRSAELKAATAQVSFAAYVSVGHVSGKRYLADRLSAWPETVKFLGLCSDLPEGVVRLDDGNCRTANSAAHQSADDFFAVFWTSGTEGRPKAVPKTHNNMLSSSLGAWQILGLPDGAIVLAPFPFVNAAGVSGLMMTWMRTAGALHLHHPFQLDIFLQQLAREAIDYTMVAPTLLAYLKDRADDEALHAALQKLTGIGTGAAPPDPAVFEFFSDVFGVEILNFFGSNEGTQLCASTNRVSDPLKRARSFPRDGDIHWQEGRGLRTVNGGYFKLVDPQNRTPVTGPGEIGEMMIAGPAVMPGYFSDSGIDRGKFDDGGFFPTADLFRISDCGSLIQFHARARELIIRGGMNISPVELDNLFATLPGTREAAVASYPDRTLGERVCVFVVPERDRHIKLEDVLLHCEHADLAKFKWPERLMTLDKLPRNPLAKLDRRALSRMLQPERTDNV